MPLEFVDTPPPPARGSSQTATQRQQELQGIANQLKAAARKGLDPEQPDKVCSKWAILAKAVRSPERWFDLRQMSVEVRVNNDGTAESMRTPGQHVVTSTIYARYVEGYKPPAKRGTAATGRA